MSPCVHVCMVSYEYGTGQGAEGICTQRLAEALCSAGAKVTVITSDKADGASSHALSPEVIRVDSQPFSPRILWRAAEKVLGNWRLFGNTYHFFWRARVARIAIPAGVDVVYGRSMPLAGCMAARILAQRQKLPLFIHFSDPVLSPWYTPPALPLRFLKRCYRQLVEAACGISFVTSEAIAYSEQVLRIPLSGKAFVLPHVSPAPIASGTRSHSLVPVLLYVGSFYGARTPDRLLAGFARLLQRRPGAILRFAGPPASMVVPAAESLGISTSVEVLPFTSNVSRLYRDADVLVAVDAFRGSPVFMSTKIIEYLQTDRPVLLLSPPDSPAAKLIAGFGDTTARTGEDAEEIAAAMERLLVRADDVAYKARLESMQMFSPTTVAALLLGQIEQRLKTPGSWR